MKRARKWIAAAAAEAVEAGTIIPDMPASRANLAGNTQFQISGGSQELLRNTFRVCLSQSFVGVNSFSF